MATAIHREIDQIQKIGSLTGAEVARAAGVAGSTVNAWPADSRTPGPEARERLLEPASIVERLAAVIQPGYISFWLLKPHRELDDEKPLDVIAKGEYRKVSRLIAGLESPPAS